MLPFSDLFAGYLLKGLVNFFRNGCKNGILVGYHLRRKIFFGLVAFYRFKHGLYREQNISKSTLKKCLRICIGSERKNCFHIRVKFGDEKVAV